MSTLITALSHAPRKSALQIMPSSVVHKKAERIQSWAGGAQAKWYLSA